MRANLCPTCGRTVMSYSRFFKEAEPTKVSLCGSCGARLRRSRGVFTLLAAMAILAMAGALGLMLWQIAFWLRLTSTALFVAAWVLLTNYLGWRLVGWVPVEGE